MVPKTILAVTQTVKSRKGGIRIDTRKKLNYKDFPVNKETKNLKIWKNLDIDQKGKLNILKNEEIYESRIYPMKSENDKIKILSKINNKTKKITYIIFSNNITTEENTVKKEAYQKLIENLEYDLINILDLDKRRVLSGKQIMLEIKQ